MSSDTVIESRADIECRADHRVEAILISGGYIVDDVEVGDGKR